MVHQALRQQTPDGRIINQQNQTLRTAPVRHTLCLWRRHETYPTRPQSDRVPAPLRKSVVGAPPH
jgi:hypothetical protein